MKDLIISGIKILIIQILCFIIPSIFFNTFFQGACFAINVILTWIFIKNVEKVYYKNYNKFNSMLYMICPVIGISLSMWLVYILTKEFYLVNYYIALIIGVYILNLLYVIKCYIKK